MADTVLFKADFFILILFSFLVPTGIYIYLIRKNVISKNIVLIYGLLFIIIAGVDIITLQTLRDTALQSTSLLDDKIFSSELSVAFYLLPALFAGIGINLISHVLIGHLIRAESRFDNRKK